MIAGGADFEETIYLSSNIVDGHRPFFLIEINRLD
jgi:hypothetical protein